MNVALVVLAALSLLLGAVVVWASLTDVASSGDASASPPPASPSPPASASPSPTAASSTSATAVPAPTRRDADLAMDSFDNAFYVESSRVGHFRVSTSSRQTAQFWRTAEMLEAVEDAYARSHSRVYRAMVAALAHGVTWSFGTDWTDRRYNDDVMWMVIASIRAYDITGRRVYLDMARRNFDRTYRRAWSGDFGGGLWWTTDRGEKNACVNSPAAIAAAMLYRRTGVASYLTEAERLYAWVRAALYEPASGRVDDNVHRASGGGVAVEYSTYTYNQGTFVGAADLLYQITGRPSYRSDAVAAIQYTRTSLTHDGVLVDEGAASDAGGFKGIFMRYAVRFTRRNHITTFDAWFRLNADVAWSHRDGHGLMGHDWTKRSRYPGLAAFDASSGVVLLQLVAG